MTKPAISGLRRWTNTWPSPDQIEYPDDGIPVVYYLYGAGDKLRYLGSTDRLCERLHEHALDKSWHRWEARECKSRHRAYHVEAIEISRLKPPLNRVGGMRPRKSKPPQPTDRAPRLGKLASSLLIITRHLPDRRLSNPERAVAVAVLDDGASWVKTFRAICDQRGYDRAHTDELVRAASKPYNALRLIRAIAENVDGYAAGEEAMARVMLGQRYHWREVVKHILKQRREIAGQ